MTKEELIDFLKENNIDYIVNNDAPIEYVRIVGKAVDIVSFNGQKQKFVPYLRVSHFGDKSGMLYVRDCGIVYWKNPEWIKKWAIKYNKGE